MSKGCDCASYNLEVGTVPNRQLDPNNYFDWDSPAKEVCIDACIAEQIKALWEAGIWTKGCCCGHGGTAPVPSPHVIIANGEDPVLAKKVLEHSDPERTWTVYQWQLVEV